MVLKLFRFYLFLFIVTLTVPYSVKAQTRVYEAFMRGHKVGQLTATKEVNDERIVIKVKSHIEAHMIVNIRVDFESNSTYMDGKLMEAEASSKTNGHDHDATHTIWKGSQYEIDLGRKSKSIQAQNLLGGDLFYFEEPQNFKQVYSLASGEMLDVVKDGPNKYYFEHGGKKELHIYDKGELSELYIEHRFYTVIFKLKK